MISIRTAALRAAQYAKNHVLVAGTVMAAVVMLTAIAITSAVRSDDKLQPATAAAPAKSSPSASDESRDDASQTSGATDPAAPTPSAAAPAPSAAPAASPARPAPVYPPAPPLRGYTPPAAWTEPGTFQVRISSGEAYLDEHGQVVAPFHIQREGGYSLAMDTVQATVTHTPPGATGITCTAAFTGTDQGYIALYGPDDAPGGQYACDLVIKSNYKMSIDTLYFIY